MNERERRLAEIRKYYPVLKLVLEGPHYGDDVGYLLGEVARLTAERDALRDDAALGALVRGMQPNERLSYIPDDLHEPWWVTNGGEWPYVASRSPEEALRAYKEATDGK